jgi:hypothetical protein
LKVIPSEVEESVMKPKKNAAGFFDSAEFTLGNRSESNGPCSE